jgi:hypothetical protein
LCSDDYEQIKTKVNDNKKISLVIGTSLVVIIIALFGLGITLDHESMPVSTAYSIIVGGGYTQMNIAYAQMNVPNGNSTTFIGNTKIPPNSNNTMTTVVNNASNNKIPTSIDRSQVAENVTAASAFTKQNASAPISASGISTPGKHPASYPPTSYPLNNSTTNNNQTNTSTNNTSTNNTSTNNTSTNNTSTNNTSTNNTSAINSPTTSTINTGCKVLLSVVHAC